MIEVRRERERDTNNKQFQLNTPKYKIFSGNDREQYDSLFRIDNFYYPKETLFDNFLRTLSYLFETVIFLT